MIEESLKEILENSLDCDRLEITNQSNLHAGHMSSPKSGESHFHILIVSDKFTGMTLLQRHKYINGLVAPLFSQGLHALSLSLYTKNQYQSI